MADSFVTSMRKSASVPSLCLNKDPDFATEVYVTSRMLQEFSARVPKRLHTLMEDFGIAHYMVVVKSPAGALHQFDFGPVGGGDIAFGQAAEPPMAAMGSWRAGRKQRAAEVRERKLASLPPLHMFVGRTQLSLDDIRAFNNLQQRQYELHRNDCRHYVDRLCEYATGVREAAGACKRAAFRQRRGAARWSDALAHAAHAVTDAASWPRVQAATRATVAMAGAMASRATLQRLRPRLLAAAQAAAAPQPRTLARSLLQQQRPRRLALATLLGASCTAGRQSPVVQAALGAGARVGEGLRWSVRGALNTVTSLPSGAASSVQDVLAVTGRGMAAAMATAGTRGAVQSPIATAEAHPMRARAQLALPRIRPARRSGALPALPAR